MMMVCALVLGRTLGGGVAGLKRWMWGWQLGRWVAMTRFLGVGSSDGGPRRLMLLSLLSRGMAAFFNFHKSPCFFERDG